MPGRPHPTRLDEDQIIELVDRYRREGDREAQEQLVTQFRDLVESVAYKFSRGQELYEDLVQVAMIGLLAAIKRYDPEVGRSFESFAVPTIVGEVKRHIRDKTWSVHVPRRIKELGPRIKKAVEQLTINLQRSPLVTEIAEYLEVTPEEILETMEMGRSYQAVSMDSPIESSTEGNPLTLFDLVGAEDEAFEKIDKQLLLEKIFQSLSSREREILELIFFENLSQKQVGDRLGISQMHVSRLQRRALKKLRQTIRMDLSEII
ncbi:RNA polymerase sigma factor SigB [Shimazuella sp. AN120528]|uniref:RNA polymerase sigma factor SigB n=1 Tax=Shimazuella soli TaxID=1892854 RepID=UPI001F1169AA|nr:RNA polymerase sigma factor SigB [Shimazuella soli]MCH5585389.1 RNA polymerase sigma factor SigB [Shimazuella soli]